MRCILGVVVPESSLDDAENGVKLRSHEGVSLLTGAYS